MLNYLALDLFFYPGQYIILNDFKFYLYTFNKKDIIDVSFYFTEYKPETLSSLYEEGIISSHYIKLSINNDCKIRIFDSYGYHACLDDVADLIDNILPNIRKLTPDELMIKDIIE